VNLDLALIERWLTGWSLARGLPLPIQDAGGLRVEVGRPIELRRHVFRDAGTALQNCAAQIKAPNIFLKATVAPDAMRAALAPHWTIDDPGYLMCGPERIRGNANLPHGYRITVETEHGGQLVRVLDASGELAAAGRVSLHAGCAVFDQIATEERHRRLGLGTLVMHTLDALAERAGVTERLLVATEAGRSLYEHLGWQVLAPWTTAVQRAD
jgi:GNAT superfamily N-acetyltransferase